jgi:hypothetical protein
LSLVIDTAQSPHYSVAAIPQSHQRAVRRLHGELAMGDLAREQARPRIGERR